MLEVQIKLVIDISVIVQSIIMRIYSSIYGKGSDLLRIYYCYVHIKDSNGWVCTRVYAVTLTATQRSPPMLY